MRPTLAIIELCTHERFTTAAEIVGTPSTNLQTPVGGPSTVS